MAERSVILDGQGFSFETDVPSIEVALREGLIEPVLSHRGGDFANANVYRPKNGLPLAGIHLLAGAGSLTPIQSPAKPDQGAA